MGTTRGELHQRMMRRALELAARGRGSTRPNPMVGCVITRGGEIVAEGYHRRVGGPHAEIEALRALRGSPKGTTVYVTLEPCNHQGRTGPCTEALIEAGVARVVYALRDPNPKVAGRGHARLKRAGIAVEGGLCAEDSAELNRGYLKWITTSRPWVTVKAAISLDGRIGTRSGDSKWITGAPARLEAHRLRARHDAILVGAGTVLADDPQLTVRGVRGRDPQRVILDGRLRVPARAKAIPGSWIFTAAPGGEAHARRGASVVRLSRRGRVPMSDVLDELGRREITSVLVEGGGEVHGALTRAGLVDEYVFFVAPVLIGGDGVPVLGGDGARSMAEAVRLSGLSVRRFGDDVCLIGRPARR